VAPPPVPDIRSEEDAHEALDSILRRLEEVFGPPPAEEVSEAWGAVPLPGGSAAAQGPGPAGGAAGGGVDDNTYLAPRDWARRWSLPQPALESRLRRWRQAHREEAGRGWMEANDRGSKEAQYIYRGREIRPILEDLRATGIRRAR
jgi:hypothetical protein